jgi:hypothetical protein
VNNNKWHVNNISSILKNAVKLPLLKKSAADHNNLIIERSRRICHIESLHLPLCSMTSVVFETALKSSLHNIT